MEERRCLIQTWQPVSTCPAERLLNRELSLLDFHARVLELAADEAIPLLERVKFCAILSSNVDEFFQVRVAGLLGQAESALTVHSADGLTPHQALARIRERVLDLASRQSRIWKRELRPALAAEGIVVGGIKDCQKKDLKELDQRFEREIYPVLTPLAVGPGQPFPYISGLSLSLAVFVQDPESGEERFARVKIPEGLPRFFAVGREGLYIPLEQVIAHFLARLFPGVSVVERAVFRVTRDADFEVSDDAADLLEAVETELRKRRFGDVVRVEVSSSASDQMVEQLKNGLAVDESQVYRIESPLDLSELMELALLDRPELKDDARVPVVPPRFAGAQSQPAALFDEIRRGDILVHQPYDSYRASFETFAQAAAQDPDVIMMKTAVYRTSNDSALVGALIRGAEEGKQSVCLVELKARFDERRNIEWSHALEQAGVHVAYGFPDMKIHAKTTLVVRREGGVLRRYVHIGTGNYHAATARQYEDIGLFTADEDITADVAELFNHITGFGRPQEFRKLLVAPFTLRSGLVDRDPQRCCRCCGRRDGSHPAQGEPPGRPRHRRRALRRLAGRRRDRRDRALDLLAAPERRGPLGEHPRPLDRRAVSRAQSRVRVRGRQAIDDLHRERRPDAAKPGSPHRGSRPRSRASGRARRCTRSSTARSRTTRTRGCSARTEAGSVPSPESPTSGTPTMRR